MPFFKKKEKKPAEEPWEIPQRRKILLPEDIYAPETTSKEYKLFRKEEAHRPGWYEKLAGLSTKLIRISPDEKTTDDLEKAIEFTGMNITPTAVFSLFVSTIIFFIIIAVVAMATGLLPAMMGVGLIAFGLLISYYFFRYPMNIVKAYRIEASSQVVLAVLYMVVSMRISPNLERALRFAAANVSGALSKDMRKLIWDIEMGKYYSAEQALDDYMQKWKSENEEFAEALRLVRGSLSHPPARARAVLDEALDVVLEGTKTRMKHYTQELRLPVMVIHMMGIVLPILGTIMAPLAAVFMSDMVKPEYFVLGYDILLPVVIIWFINSTLQKRPMTFMQVDISKHPDAPKKGCFKRNVKNIPVLPIALAVMLLIIIYPIIFFAQNPNLLVTGIESQKQIPKDTRLFSLLMSTLLIFGIGAGLSVYFILTNFQKVRMQEKIEHIESEFELALFQLGNKVASGTPTEVAIEKCIDDVKDLEISGLFKACLNNIRNLGMTFEQALFHPVYGAIKYYPSMLVRNVMYTIIDTAKKGVVYASEGMLRISKYLTNIRETQEYMRELLSETVSSMKFQAYFLTPIITGLIVSMAAIIISVLSTLGVYLQGLGVDQLGMVDITTIFGGMKSSISSELFQIIIGVYLLEVVYILSMFVTKINYGKNEAIKWYSVGKNLIIALLIYMLVLYFSSSMFVDMISEALSGLGMVA